MASIPALRNVRPAFRTSIPRSRIAFPASKASKISVPKSSRRYLCVEIPQDTIILNDREIEYDQLYAQVVYEIREQHLPYWFTSAETRRIEEQNVKFQRVSDLESMVTACFRRLRQERWSSLS